MATLKIVHLTAPEKGGSQLKLFVRFENGGRAILKPQRFDRQNSIRNRNQFHYFDYERANAEVASYHLDRVLGFYRVPPTVGRVVNITKEIEPLAYGSFKSTFFKSPIGSTCFFGHCWIYCHKAYAFCGNPDMIEVSLQAMLPSYHRRYQLTTPWVQSFKSEKGEWETNSSFCDKFKPTLKENRFLLDLIDVHIFDFIADNKDRHEVETFAHFANQSAPILFDNGKAFGHPDFDELSIMAPLYQCCLVRHSTLEKLLSFQRSPNRRLSQAFIESSKKDPIYPLVRDDFPPALDRRLETILETIRKCVKVNGFENVVFDDGI